MTSVPNKIKVPKSKALREEIAMANRAGAEERRGAAAAHRASQDRENDTTWVHETDRERRVRMAKDKAVRDRAEAAKKKNPDSAAVADVVTSEARLHGDYRHDDIEGPIVVKAGVPRRMPLVIIGFCGSFGMPFLLHVMCAACRTVSASLPVSPLGRRSTSITWLSVRPLTMRRPRSVSVSARTRAFFATCCW